jgi:uncharacterized hydrophobic protein (TIGR00271 family)
MTASSPSPALPPPDTAADAPAVVPPSRASGGWRSTLRQVVSLRDDADEAAAVQAIRAGVDFRGGNFWALVLAIVVASVGLNVNSTAVIIGAMLISPLMGPLMGIGLGLGTDDLPLVRRALRTLAIAAAASVATSALFFVLSPLAEAQSELLARTRPTVYDVLVALAGGSAGIVALTRRGGGGNVLPGVAIATALMPPLCTAGFGLSRLDPAFVFGALYLFLINAVLISVSTLVVVRILGFATRVSGDAARARRVHRLVTWTTVLTVLPSIWVAWQVVQETRLEAAARRFVAARLAGDTRTVLRTEVRHRRDSTVIDVTLLGTPIAAPALDMLRAALPAAGLAGTRLVVHQLTEGALGAEQVDAAVRAGVLAELSRRSPATEAVRDSLRAATARLAQREATALAVAQAGRELAVLVPEVAGTRAAEGSGTGPATVLVTWRRPPAARERDRITRYLRTRLGDDALQVEHLLAP